MADNDDRDVDLAAPGAGETNEPPQPRRESNTSSGSDGGGRGPLPPPELLLYHESEYFKRSRHDAYERRWTRLIMYTVVMLFAVLFLASGLSFALKVGDGLLTAKQTIVKALTSDRLNECVVPLKCITEDVKATPPAAEQARNSAITANLNADWLSASSLIAIVAFILGVGLTLILTLLKATYQHPTDKDIKRSEDSSTTELATPLSQLFERAIGYLKEKFSK
ncbi:hypothetical protein OGY15_00720 [Citrobacter sp. Cu231]|uniref:hypothetical protein n=1 Tax=Citrobacter sp. Cu231 TaxID=2985159 RepID=UPI002578682F|nr:hypothetical protein [Citrobacter sp. Cu231]MDM2743193.1 hypothetical protein [Citrobacter sp. Cu231]